MESRKTEANLQQRVASTQAALEEADQRLETLREQDARTNDESLARGEALRDEIRALLEKQMAALRTFDSVQANRAGRMRQVNLEEIDRLERQASESREALRSAEREREQTARALAESQAALRQAQEEVAEARAQVEENEELVRALELSAEQMREEEGQDRDAAEDSLAGTRRVAGQI